MIRVSTVLLAAVAAAIGCNRQEPESGEAPQAQLLQSASNDASETAPIAGRQQRLLRALVNPPDSIGEFITLDFTLFDEADSTTAVSRDFRGKQVLGQDYFRALSARLGPAHAVIHEIEVFSDRPGSAVAITIHETISPTVTAWERDDNKWMAKRMTINTSPQRIADIRAHFAAGTPMRAY